VHPNGIIRICSGMLGTPYGVARFSKNKITWDDSDTNELRDHKIKSFTPCTNQSKGKKFGDYVPLCFSFKPKQKELIWQKLHWENKKSKIFSLLPHLPARILFEVFNYFFLDFVNFL
jgi:hypothetical protein